MEPANPARTEKPPFMGEIWFADCLYHPDVLEARLGLRGLDCELQVGRWDIPAARLELRERIFGVCGALIQAIPVARLILRDLIFALHGALTYVIPVGRLVPGDLDIDVHAMIIRVITVARLILVGG